MHKELYFLRHGATALQGLYAGSTDVPLAEEGRSQIVQTGKVLVDKGIELIYCSPMKRCRETLNLLHLDVTCEIDENIREIDFGRWEGCSFSEITQIDSRLVEDWRINSESFCFPEGECVHDFNKRIDLFGKKVLAAPENRILIISHGGIIRHLLCTFSGLSPEKRMIFDIQAGAVSSMVLYGDIGVLRSLNVKR